MPLARALALADEAQLDLVEIAASASPPVCKIIDYARYRYQLEQRRKEARKHQKRTVVRQIKLRPKIAEHDYQTKRRHVERFIGHGELVKLTIMFRGREQTHPELGRRLLDRIVEDLSGQVQVDQPPSLQGRDMTMVISPARAGHSEQSPN